MAIKCGFFDSVDGDRKYTAEDIGRYLHGLVSSGVYADSSRSMQVLIGSYMEIEVQKGRAMLDGYYMELTEPYRITLSEGGAQRRIDAIVARLDKTRRLCEIAILEGTPGTTPAVPTVTRSETVKEYMLAYVEIPALAVAIYQDQIYDTRADKAVCGWVTGIIDQVDTSTLYTQWETAYKAAFDRFTKDADAYMQSTIRAFDEFMQNLTQDLRVLTYIEEHVTNHMVKTAGASPVVPINVESYDPRTDVLFVNFRGLTYPIIDYTIIEYPVALSGYAVRLDNATHASGDLIELRVLKSKIGATAT